MIEVSRDKRRWSKDNAMDKEDTNVMDTIERKLTETTCSQTHAEMTNGRKRSPSMTLLVCVYCTTALLPRHSLSHVFFSSTFTKNTFSLSFSLFFFLLTFVWFDNFFNLRLNKSCSLCLRHVELVWIRQHLKECPYDHTTILSFSQRSHSLHQYLVMCESNEWHDSHNIQNTCVCHLKVTSKKTFVFWWGLCWWRNALASTHIIVDDTRSTERIQTQVEDEIR